VHAGLRLLRGGHVFRSSCIRLCGRRLRNLPGLHLRGNNHVHLGGRRRLLPGAVCFVPAGDILLGRFDSL
jgi:hypothetical protein